MTFNVKRRGRVAYYYQGDSPTISSLVTEDLGEGDVKIYFAGLTGGHSAKGVLGRDELVTMEPKREVELVFRSWESGYRTRKYVILFPTSISSKCMPSRPNPRM